MDKIVLRKRDILTEAFLLSGLLATAFDFFLFGTSPELDKIPHYWLYAGGTFVVLLVLVFPFMVLLTRSKLRNRAKCERIQSLALEQYGLQVENVQESLEKGKYETDQYTFFANETLTELKVFKKESTLLEVK